MQSDQVMVKNSWGRLVLVLDWMSPDLEDLQHISASNREGWDVWIKTQYSYYVIVKSSLQGVHKDYGDMDVSSRV